MRYGRRKRNVSQAGGPRESVTGRWAALPMRGVALAAMLLGALLCVAFAQPAGATSGSTSGLGYSLTPSKTRPYTPCPPGGHMIECNIVVDPPAVRTSSGYRLPGGGPLLEGGGEGGGYDPKDLQSAYSIPTSGGSGETVAVVEAWGYKEAESDLAKYREKYGLSACTKANGCFKKVNQKGEEKNYPKEGEAAERSWSLETALDMDMVSAACPNCDILVVEATTEEPKDTAAATEEAATLKATEISNSYGYPENDEALCPGKKGCSEYLSAYKHTGIPVTVSAGDSGYDDGGGAPSWPATSPNVIAVGGTNLNKAENSRGWKETVWAGSGSGCSLYEAKPAWQTDTGCTKRTDNDVAAVAAPETPVSVYNTPYAAGWINVGGTSVSAPLVAGIEAHAESTTKTAAAEAFYKHPGMLFDVTSGKNGTCTPPTEDAYLCAGEAGYDGPTGWGTPDGVPHLSGWFTRGIPSFPADLYVKHSLPSVSCASTTPEICIAVGHYTSASGGETILAEEWNSTSKEWVTTEVPSPTGAKSASLTEISCQKVVFGLVAIDECVAAGHYVNSSGAERPFGERWDWEDSGRWEVSTVATPTEAKSTTLSGVSCGETCIGVGHYLTSTGVEETFAVQATGTEWAIKESLNPKEAKSSSLASVSCETSDKDCMAVGHYVSGTGTEATLAEYWNGEKWSITKSPNPKEAKSSSFTSISCITITNFPSCVAVGQYVNAAGTELALASRSLGEGWGSQESEAVNPAEAKSATLSGVSCTGEAGCNAVGHYVNKSGTELTLAEVIKGEKWSIQESPSPTGAKRAALSSVSCTAIEACTAAGNYVNSEGVELSLGEVFTSTAKKWALQEPLNAKEAGGSLPGVSCSATEACTAVGHYLNALGVVLPLAERWNGKEWALQETPDPTGAKSASLSGVSCSAAEACMAVGHFVNSGGTEVPLAEVWSSKKWTVQEPPDPTGAKSGSLSGVSCTAAEACTAVGHYVTSGGVEETLGEVFTSTAKKWALQEPVNPTGAKSGSLSGVSCTAAEACTAVGHYVTSGGVEETLGEVFTSTAKKWALQEPVNPTGAKSSSLSGVSCTAAEACTAVGHYVTSGGVEETLGEVFTSTAKKWALQEPVNPTGAKSSSLSGVSCTAAEACTAVGHYVNSGSAEVTLAEVFTSATKKWAVQETPNPGEVKSNSLSGVSCKTATACIASGDGVNGAGTEVPLVEEHA